MSSCENRQRRAVDREGANRVHEVSPACFNSSLTLVRAANRSSLANSDLAEVGVMMNSAANEPVDFDLLMLSGLCEALFAHTEGKSG